MRTRIFVGALRALAAPAVLFALAGPVSAAPADFAGTALAAATAAGPWHTGPSFPGVADDQPALLSCASAGWCLAVDQQLQQTWVLQGGKWRTGPFGAAGQGVPTALSCISPGTCTGADAQGDILSFAHERWSARPGPSQQGGGPMSCATARLCLFVNGVGQWFTWDGHQASHPRVAYPALANTMGSGIYALSCASGTSFCAAADSLGALGTFSAGRWGPLFTKVTAPPVSIGCYSAKACVAAFRPGAGSGARSGTWATWDGRSWSVHPAGTRGLPPVPASTGSLSCSARACTLLYARGGHAGMYRWTSAGWSPAVQLKGAAAQLVSCSASGACTAVRPGTSPKEPGSTWWSS
ncbi:MAG TPA: hypothetical protein VFN61_00845 [Acidimicrobiales bacterium]|nr:hypothetical protein [Acidimicrobiales bacterium]